MSQLNNSLDFKLEYMSRLFKKISHKPIESYVIQRLWHKMDDPEIKFVLQQYVSRKEDKYALVDLYLPQFNIAIEVNEPYHLDEKQHERDEKRNTEVSNIINCEVKCIDCSKSLLDIHEQIDVIIQTIKEKKKELGNGFKPWTGKNEMLPETYKATGYLSVNENNYVETIDKICEIFDTKVVHRGFLRAGAADYDDEYLIWFPSIYSKEWENKLIENGKYITEKNTDDKKNISNIDSSLNNKNIKKRITFFREKDALGFNFYKFVGVFEFDKKRTCDNKKAIYWKRICKKFNLKSKDCQ